MTATSTHGIEIHTSHLVIPGSRVGTPTITIREQPLATYATFVTAWKLAMAQATKAPTATLPQLWVKDAVFRGHLSEALEAVGVREPATSLLPNHLIELVLTASAGDDDTRGLIFRLHSDRPDPDPLPPDPKGQPRPPSTKPLSWFTRLLRFWGTGA